jgi:surfeit locus 1 family protein
MKVRTRYPGWLPTLAAVIGLAVTLSAAYWQFGRAAYKEQLQHEFRLRQEAPPVVVETANALPDTEIALRKVTVTGRYLAEHTIYLDNRLRDGIAGYEVVTPLSTGTAAAVVLVNRGWIRAAAERNVLPQVDTPAGPVTVTGTAVVPSGRILELSDQTVEGAVWQNLVLPRYREMHRLDVTNFVIQQEDALEYGLDRRWAEPGFGVRTHQSYAVQWLIFAILIIIFYAYYGFLRRDNDEPPSQ